MIDATPAENEILLRTWALSHTNDLRAVRRALGNPRSVHWNGSQWAAGPSSETKRTASTPPRYSAAFAAELAALEAGAPLPPAVPAPVPAPAPVRSTGDDDWAEFERRLSLPIDDMDRMVADLERPKR